MSTLPLRAAVFALIAGLVACDTGFDDEGDGMDDDAPSDDGDDATDDDDDGDDDDGGDDGDGPQECHAALPKGTVATGDPCTVNIDCKSHVCEIFDTVTAPGGGVCTATPPSCNTRIMGTVRDIRTGVALPDAEIALLPAANAAVGTDFAPRLIDEVSDANGRFDTVTETPIDAFIAVLGLVEREDYLPTLTGLSGPIDSQRNYEACFAYREWWAVSESDIQAWNESLADDSEIASHLPITASGSIVGFLRSTEYPGNPVEGARVYPKGDTSTAQVRYVNEDGRTTNTTATSSNGVFIVFGSGGGEQFLVDRPGMVPFAPDAARAGAFPDATYAMAIWMVPQ